MDIARAGPVGGMGNSGSVFSLPGSPFNYGWKGRGAQHQQAAVDHQSLFHFVRRRFSAWPGFLGLGIKPAALVRFTLVGNLFCGPLCPADVHYGSHDSKGVWVGNG